MSPDPSLSKKSFRQAAALFQTLKSLKKWFDYTRKTTLTVFFHTIFPSETLSLRGYRQSQVYLSWVSASSSAARRRNTPLPGGFSWRGMPIRAS